MEVIKNWKNFDLLYNHEIDFDTDADWNFMDSSREEMHVMLSVTLQRARDLGQTFSAIN